MDWEALVQSLWDLTRQNGRTALETHVRSAMDDQPCEALVLALELLQTDGRKDAFAALLLESLTNGVSVDHRKYRLQLSLAFEIPQSNTLTPLIDMSDFVDEIHNLVMENLFTEAVSKIHGALKAKQDNIMLELLGRVTILQQSHEASLPYIVEPSDMGNDKNPPVDRSDSESSFDLFVWQESDISGRDAHDDSCIASASAQQDMISKSTPVDPMAIEWDIDLEAWAEPTRVTSTTPASELTISNITIHVDNTDAIDVENKIEMVSNPEKLAQQARKSYLDQKVMELQAEDKKLLGIIFDNPKISLDQLSRLATIRAPAANQVLGTRLLYWIERDRLGGFSIKKDLVNLIAEGSLETQKMFRKKIVSGTQINPTAYQSNKTEQTDSNESTSLSVQAKAVLDFFSQQPGTKTYKAAEALGMDHVALLSLLSGRLADYLEKDKGFSVFLRPRHIKPRSHDKVIERSPQVNETCIVEIFSENELTKIPQRIEHPASQVGYLSHTPDDTDTDTDYTLKDLEKAAALSRLPLLGKDILALLATRGKSYSRDIARELGHDVDDINKMLLNKLNDHVYVTHSVWRLSDGVVDALKYAAII